MNAVALSLIAEGVDGVDPGDPLSLIQSLGFPLAFVILLSTGWIVTKREYNRAIEDRDAKQVALDDLQRTLLQEVVPAITRSTDAVMQSNDLIRSIASRQVGGG